MSLLKQNIQEGNNAFNFVPPKLKIAKREKTIGNYITFTGIGLHSGKKVKMTLHPAPVNTGYVFRVNKKQKDPFL